MGLIYTDITLSNPYDEMLMPIESKALVDTGALFLCIPEHIALQLKLKEYEKREVKIEFASYDDAEHEEEKKEENTVLTKENYREIFPTLG